MEQTLPREPQASETKDIPGPILSMSIERLTQAISAAGHPKVVLLGEEDFIRLWTFLVSPASRVVAAYGPEFPVLATTVRMKGFPAFDRRPALVDLSAQEAR